MEKVAEIISNPETCGLGVNLLRIISEEWTSSRARISSRRKAKVKDLLLSRVNQFFDLLTSLLISIFDSYVLVSSNVSQSFQDRPSNANFSPDIHFESSLANNPEALSLVKDVFATLQHFVSWVPLGQVLQVDHLEPVYKYVLLNDEASNYALDFINEILERNYMPAEIAQHLKQLQSACLAFLNDINSRNLLATVSEDTLSRWNNFVNLYAQFQLKRDQGSNISEFLLYFGKYTFLQPNTAGILDCLDIWEQIFLIITGIKSERGSLESLEPIICEFAETLLRSIMFRYNGEQMEKLDATMNLDERAMTADEESCELDDYVNSGINIVFGAFSLFPAPFLPLVMPLLMETFEGASHLHEVLIPGAQLDPQTSKQMWYIIKDTTTFIRFIALAGSQFMEQFEETFDTAATLLKSVLDLVLYFKEHNIQSYSPESARLLAELFGSMRGFGEWIGLYSQRVSSLQQYPSMDPTQFDAMISDLIQADCVVLQSRSIATHEGDVDIPEIVPLAGAVHLRVLASHIRNPRVLNLPIVQNLMQNVHYVASCHTYDVAQALYVGVELLLLTPWNNTAPQMQDWENRASMFSNVFSAFIENYKIEALQIVNREVAAIDDERRVMLERSLVVMTGLLRLSVGHLDKNGLMVLYGCFEEVFKLSITMINFYMDDIEMQFRLVQFYIQIFTVLANVVPPNVASEMVLTVVGAFNNHDKLDAMITDEHGAAEQVMNRLLSLLKALLSRPQAPFLSDVYTFLINRFYPHIETAEASILIEQSYYEVWLEMLHHYSVICSDLNVHQAYINCLLHAINSDDPDIYKMTVEYMISIDQKKRIFQYERFIQDAYYPITSSLMDTILHRNMETFKNETLKLIYAIASGAGLDRFFHELVPAYLSSAAFANVLDVRKSEQLVSILGSQTDPPSFSRNLTSFLEDLSLLLPQENIDEETS